MSALALTDYNGVYGAVRFIKSAQHAAIKPIIGTEVRVNGIGKLVLLVRSAQGYANLCKILSEAMMESQLNPVVSQESLSANARDLFALLGAPLGDLLKDGKRKGIDRNVAQDILDQLSTLAAFGFNKAHACSFAQIVFQSVYLKAYHPAEFMIGVLNNLPGMYPERVLLHDAGRHGITILKPDINKSGVGYALEDGAIRVGLRGIRNVGPTSMARIFEQRAKGGPFEDLEDFRSRVKVREKLLRSMILSGVFDSLFENRRSLLRCLEGKISKGKAEDFSVREKVACELEHIGLDLTAHAMSLFRDSLDRLGVSRSLDLRKYSDGERVAIAGIKVVFHTPPTRSGIRVVFVTLEDETGLSDVAVFPDVQERCGTTLFTADALVVEGKVRRLADSISVNAEKVTNLKGVICRK